MSSKVAFVTGASQGIGRSTAVRLAQDFDAITLVARNRDNLDQTAVEVNAAIVALAKAFSDHGVADGVQVNSVLTLHNFTNARRWSTGMGQPRARTTRNDRARVKTQKYSVFGRRFTLAELLPSQYSAI